MVYPIVGTKSDREARPEGNLPGVVRFAPHHQQEARPALSALCNAMADKIQADNLTRRGAGRPKGSPNKTTAAAKAVIAEAAERLGGTDRLVSWAQEAPENERAFWATIYPKLLPLQHEGSDGGPLQVVIQRFSD